jgi:hypothetical protein
MKAGRVESIDAVQMFVNSSDQSYLRLTNDTVARMMKEAGMDSTALWYRAVDGGFVLAVNSTELEKTYLESLK